jgi:hypothetical protein
VTVTVRADLHAEGLARVILREHPIEPGDLEADIGEKVWSIDNVAPYSFALVPGDHVEVRRSAEVAI